MSGAGPQRGRALALALGALLGLLAGRARAEDDSAMGRRLQEALRAQRGEVHRCYGAALLVDPKLQGELLLRLVMAEGGRVAQAEVLKDQAGSPVLVACLRQAMLTWRLPQLEAAAGDEVVFPLVFRPDEAEPPDEAGPRVVVQRGREGPDFLSGALALRAVAPGRVWALDSAESGGVYSLVFVLGGQARPRAGLTDSRDLRPGDGLAVPAGGDEVRLQSIGVSPLKLLRLRVGAAAGAVPARATALRGSGAAWLMVPAGPSRERAPQGQVRILADAVMLGAPPPASLAELGFPAGAEVPVHQHDGSDELIYITGGGGVMTVGADRVGARREVVVGPGDVVFIPRGVPHGLRVTARLSAVQSYTPAGPEARFRQQPRR